MNSVSSSPFLAAEIQERVSQLKTLAYDRLFFDTAKKPGNAQLSAEQKLTAN